MTVDWITFAQSLTTKPVKGMLTGPVTILAWSFVRDDQPLADSADQVALVEAYAKAQGMWRVNGQKAADYTDVLELDLGAVLPSMAGPKAASGLPSAWW